MIWYYDTETNGLLHQMDTVHCVVFVGPDDEVLAFHDRPDLEPHNGPLREVPDFVDSLLSDGHVLCAHNGINFDDVVMREFLGADPGETLDTQVMSGLVLPDLSDYDWTRKVEGMPVKLYGSPSLEAWGWRIGEHKDQYDGGWEDFSQSMLDYCIQDTVVCKRVGEHLMDRMVRYPGSYLQREHDFARQLSDTMRAGARWDPGAAQRLLVRLHGDLAAALDTIRSTWPDEEVVEYTPVRKQERRRIVTFNPRSGPQVIARLRPWGYRPERRTATGEFSTEEDQLQEFVEQLRDAGREDRAAAVEAVNRYRMIRNRLTKLEEGRTALMNHLRDGRLTFRIKHIGTLTHRCAHSQPPVGQLTSVRKPYGREFRELVVPAPGYVLVGGDFASLELRLLAHRLAPYDGGEFARVVMDGDPHEHNREIMARSIPGVTRSKAKEAFYAILYGATAARLARVFGVDQKRAGRLLREFKEGLVGLGQMVEDMANDLRERGMARLEPGKHGRPWLRLGRGASIEGLDGRRVPVRSAHSLLNFRLQSDGAIVVKQGTVAMRSILDQMGLVHHNGTRLGDWGMVMHMHDEIQSEARAEHGEAVAHAFLEAARSTTNTFGLACPMSGDVKIGKSWAETH